MPTQAERRAPSQHRGMFAARALRGRLSGLCQPTYVLDIPGGHGKVPIGPSYIARADRDLDRRDSGRIELEEFELEDISGVRHRYRDCRYAR